MPYLTVARTAAKKDARIVRTVVGDRYRFEGLHFAAPKLSFKSPKRFSEIVCFRSKQ